MRRGQPLASVTVKLSGTLHISLGWAILTFSKSRTRPAMSYQTAVEAIEKKIYATPFYNRKVLAELKLHRNSLLPVSRLPPEILCMIFLLYIHIVAFPDDLSLDEWHTWDTRRYRWPVVSHVCSSWREVAHSTKAMWTIFPVMRTNHEAVKSFMLRSGQAPLSIAAHHTSEDEARKALQVFVSEIHRARTLDLGSSGEAFSKLQHQIPTCAPLLRSLRITEPPK